MVKNSNKTYGTILQEQQAKGYMPEDDVREYSNIMAQARWQEVQERAAHDSKLPYYEGKDFYVVLALRKEPIGNQPQALVWTRLSCPTPTYNQNVFKYHHVSATLEYLWTIPTQVTYWNICRDPQRFLKDKECADLARFVLLMESGELLQWVIKENGEKPDGAIIIKEKEH